MECIAGQQTQPGALPAAQLRMLHLAASQYLDPTGTALSPPPAITLSHAEPPNSPTAGASIPGQPGRPSQLFSTHALTLSTHPRTHLLQLEVLYLANQAAQGAGGSGMSSPSSVSSSCSTPQRGAGVTRRMDLTESGGMGRD